MKTLLLIATTVVLMTGCQHMNSPTLNGTEQTGSASENWIKQNAATNAQKQALSKLNQAQQRIKQLNFSNSAALNPQLFEVTKENQVAQSLCHDYRDYTGTDHGTKIVKFSKPAGC
ncbi:MAG: hypothetical protein EOO68_34490, partial [Moraxellaceae bacterium]